MSSKADETRTLEAECLCGGVHLTLDVPASRLPLAVYLCHCSVCRYNTGSPCVFHTKLPEGVLPSFVGESREDNLRSYTVEGASCSYVFCSTCGCHVGATSLDGRLRVVATSIFKDHGPDSFRIRQHIFSNSAKGAGLAGVVKRLGGDAMASWNPPDHEPRARLVECEAEVGDDGQDRLRAQCQCGGVSLTLRRPTDEVLDDAYMSRFVSPRDRRKWKAIFDTCSDCRLASGSHVVGWAFVPRALCEPPVGADLSIGTAKTYASSEGVLRAFCGVCGATVFLAAAERRPSDGQAIVDIATGILRAPEGVMAEDWLTWRTAPAFAASGTSFDGDFGEAMSGGMKAWTEEAYGETVDFDVF